jgi:hypothetical protein
MTNRQYRRCSVSAQSTWKKRGRARGLRSQPARCHQAGILQAALETRDGLRTLDYALWGSWPMRGGFPSREHELGQALHAWLTSKEHVVKPFPVAARTAFAVAACVSAAGLLAACGSSSGPSAQPTKIITVTVPAPSAPATTPATPTPTPTPAGPAGCATTALTASLGPGSGAAGSRYFPINFTNTSGSNCSLYGYPGVSFVTAAGAQVGAAATEDPTYPRRLITLAPGATAHAELRIADAQNYPAATCHPAAVHRLKIFPPGQTSVLYLTLSATACSRTSVQILAVQTVQPARGSQ